MTDSDEPSLDMSSFSMHYRGDHHHINADTLAVSLLTTSEVIALINQNVGDDESLEVKVNASKQSSFEVELTLNASEVGNAFADAFSYADSVLGALVGVLELYRFRSTHDVEEIEEGPNGRTYHAENGDQYHVEEGGTLLVVSSSDEKSRESIKRNFQALLDDGDVEGFDLEAEDDGPAFRASRDEFAQLAEGPSEEREQEKVVEAVISVYQPSLDGSRQWGVTYDGHKIQASVEDDGFLRRVQNNSIKLGNGDKLNVDLKIMQEWDPAAQDWLNQSYSIVSVYDVIPAGRQSDAFSENE